VQHSLAGHARPTVEALLGQLDGDRSDKHLKKSRKAFTQWQQRQDKLTRSDFDDSIVGKIRSLGDNPDELIRPESVAASLDRHAAQDAIFTSDTGMATVWLSRFITMSGQRRLLGSYNLGSMANAMPQALGAQALDRTRQVVASCGDGG